MDITIGPGDLDGRGLFAGRDFEAGEEVAAYRLRELTAAEFGALCERDQLLFVHSYAGRRFLYPVPARYTNHSDRPSAQEEFEPTRLIALRRIAKGDPITVDARRETAHELATFMEALSLACVNADSGALSGLVAEPAVVWLPDGDHRGASAAAGALQRFYTADRALPATGLEWIVGRHRWEAVGSFTVVDRATAERWHASVALQILEGNWQVVYAHVGGIDPAGAAA